MRRDSIDFHRLECGEDTMHTRLVNWALYVQVRGVRWQSPIWRLGKSNGRQWHEPRLKAIADALDGHKIEKAVAQLPAPHRDALRWFYVYRTHPTKARKALGVTEEGLSQLVRDGRTMLRNRGV